MMDNDVAVEMIDGAANHQIIINSKDHQEPEGNGVHGAKTRYKNGDASCCTLGSNNGDADHDQVLAKQAVSMLANGLVDVDPTTTTMKPSVVNKETAAVTGESSKLNTTKEYGKFRILKNYALNNEEETPGTQPKDVDDKKLNGTVTPDLNGHDAAIKDGDVSVPCPETEIAKSATKRKGNKSKKSAATESKEQDREAEKATQSPRRRSTRLRNRKAAAAESNESRSGPVDPQRSAPLSSDINHDVNAIKSKDSCGGKKVSNGEATTTSKESKKSKDKKKRKTKHKTKNKEHKLNKKHKKSSSKKSSGKGTAAAGGQKKRSTKEKSDRHRQSSSLKENNFAQPQDRTGDTASAAPVTETNGGEKSVDSLPENKPEKVKSRWRRNSELENTSVTVSSPLSPEKEAAGAEHGQAVLQDRTNVPNEPLPHYQQIEENIFLFERKKCKSKKETKKMVCDCILTKEERARGLMGCGEDCLNRMLLIECSARCPLGEHCSNKRFQLKQNAKVEPFKTAKKGWGLRAQEPLSDNTFIMEYVGEVIDPFEFHDRVEKYSRQRIEHYYFMALKSDEIIDATTKGNITRFINHSCEPNAITQKWTVNGELRIGFFTIKPVSAGEEITFDYQFQRYGKKAQVCYCETASCRGFIGSSEGGANILTDGSKIPKSRPKKADRSREDGQEHSDEEQQEEDEDDDEDEFLKDVALEEEIEYLIMRGGLRNRQQILEVSRLMLRAENCQMRLKLIDILMTTHEFAYLRLFLDYHGLQIIWSWMVEAEDIDLKARLLELLEVLPIPNKTMLMDSKVYQMVERWAAKDSPESRQYLLNINDENKPAMVKEEEPVEPDSAKSSQDQPTTAAGPPLKEEVEETAKPPQETPTGSIISVTPEKKSDLSKLSAKVIIKSKTKSAATNSGPTAVGSVAVKDKSNVTVGFLAQKLLTHWKDLKEVFRIPRLERQKRHDDEAEADRRALEHEVRRAQGLPIIPEKRTIDDRDYTIAGILGNKRRCLKSLTTGGDRELFKRAPPSSVATSSGFIGNNFATHTNSPKMSKEEHRKLFEYNVAQSDYTEALKKYQEQLEEYRRQMYFMTLQHNVAAVTTSTDPTAATVAMLPNKEMLYLPSYAGHAGGVTPVAYPPAMLVEPMATVDSTELYVEPDMEDLMPVYQNPVIVLTGRDEVFNDDRISPMAIDNVDYDQIKFDIDECLDTIDKKMFNDIYPPVGIFFLTEGKKTFFAPFSESDQDRGIVRENHTEPLPNDFTTNKPVEDQRWIADGWRWKATENGHYYYYNRKRNISQWHPPLDSQIDEIPYVVTANHIPDLVNDANCDISHPSTTNSTPVSGNTKKDLSELSLEDLKRKNAKRTQELFRNKISQFVVKCLNPYMKSTCRKARITRSEDFKALARKITHAIVAKEMKQCKHIEDLACTESVKHKTKEYVRRYMGKFGSVYSPGFEQHFMSSRDKQSEANNGSPQRPPSVGQ